MSETPISNVRKRKRLLHLRAQLCEQWDRAFPHHNFETGRLREPRSLAADAWNDPGWARAAREYHVARGDRVLIVETELKLFARLRELMADNVSLDRAWHELNDARARPTPKATVEAIWHAVRERGLTALIEPSNQERLKSCDPDARAELARRIETLRQNEVSS
jgi:hypothetical protein